MTPMLWLKRGLLIAALVPLLILSVICLAYWTIPERNTDQKRFDTIIVLGSPANPDGTPGPEQRERTLEGVREFDNGVAPHVIMTGGAAHNRYVESEVMAKTAEENGVPASAIFEDKQSRNTIENAYYAVRIMRAHEWRSAEIVSSASHLPRASLIFSRFPIKWRMHAAPGRTRIVLSILVASMRRKQCTAPGFACWASAITPICHNKDRGSFRASTLLKRVESVARSHALPKRCIAGPLPADSDGSSSESDSRSGDRAENGECRLQPWLVVGSR